MILAAVPCYHIAREILAGLLVKGGDQSAVLCGHVPQFVPAIAGGKAGKTARVDLQKARVLFAGQGVVQNLVGGFLPGGNIQLHPVAQGVAVVEKAVCRGSISAVDRGAVLFLHHHPAVLAVVGIPVVIVQPLRAGVAAEHQLIAAYGAAICTFRYRQRCTGGKVDDLTGAVAGLRDVSAIDQAALLQHQQAVLQGGALLALKGHYFGAGLVVQGGAAPAPASGVGPAAQPVVCGAGGTVLHQRDVFTAGRLVQRGAAAQDGGAAPGTAVAVQHPQTAIVQHSGVVQGLAAVVRGHRGGRACSARHAGSGRQQGTAAAQGKDKGSADCPAADTQDNTLHKKHSFAKTGRKIFPFTQNTKQPHFSLQILQKNAAKNGYNCITTAPGRQCLLPSAPAGAERPKGRAAR